MQKNISFLNENFSETSYITLVKPEQKQPLFLCSCCGNLLAYKGLCYCKFIKNLEIILFFWENIGYLMKSKDNFSMFKAMY